MVANFIAFSFFDLTKNLVFDMIHLQLKMNHKTKKPKKEKTAMRHKNYYKNLHSFFHSEPGKTYVISHPYRDLYTYSKPSMKFKYMKLIQFIADHPDCSRREASIGVYGRYSCGYQSGLFSNLLYHDYIDYGTKFHYRVTSKGEELLKKAYLNDCAKIVVD